jgi:hypothetical protein
MKPCSHECIVDTAGCCILGCIRHVAIEYVVGGSHVDTTGKQTSLGCRCSLESKIAFIITLNNIVFTSRYLTSICYYVVSIILH